MNPYRSSRTVRATLKRTCITVHKPIMQNQTVQPFWVNSKSGPSVILRYRLDQSVGHRNDHETDQNPQPEGRKVPKPESKFVHVRYLVRGRLPVHLTALSRATTEARSRAIASDRAKLDGSRLSIVRDSHQGDQQHAGAASGDECEQGPPGRNHGICAPLR